MLLPQSLSIVVMILGDTDITFRCSMLSIHWRMMLMFSVFPPPLGRRMGGIFNLSKRKRPGFIILKSDFNFQFCHKQGHFLAQRQDFFLFLLSHKVPQGKRRDHFISYIPRAWHRSCQSMLIDQKEGRKEGRQYFYYWLLKSVGYIFLRWFIDHKFENCVLLFVKNVNKMSEGQVFEQVNFISLFSSIH